MMDSRARHQLVGMLPGLADASVRASVALKLAALHGARALFAFVPCNGALSPAAGFPSAVPSNRGWTEILARCAAEGVYTAEVAFPNGDETCPCVAYAYPGLCLAFVGVAEGDPSVHVAIAPFAPLVASLLAVETELRQAREALAVEREASTRAARIKDELLGVLGHELRNPLAPIVTALQLLRLDGIHTRAQEVLERQVAHLRHLVDDLLDVSRIARGKIELRREPVQIASVVQAAIEMARPLLEQRQCRLEIDVPGEGVVVDGDHARLAQIVTNLLTNAAKYSATASVVHIHASSDQQTVRVVIEDHGSGIDPSDLDAIFERFVQTPQGIDRSAGGLGLGLPIARSLTELHGGTLHAASQGRDRGSRFTIELPASQACPRSAPPKLPSRVKAAGANVLVVDDNTDAAELLGEILSAYGHCIRLAHDGPSALATIESFTPDIALLDIGLPVMDGYELASRLRERLPDLHLVALTGYGRPDDRTRTVEAGFAAHLVKPVSVARVTETLEKLLRDRLRN